MILLNYFYSFIMTIINKKNERIIYPKYYLKEQWWKKIEVKLLKIKIETYSILEQIIF